MKACRFECMKLCMGLENVKDMKMRNYGNTTIDIWLL
jgi:hypothetical protein